VSFEKYIKRNNLVTFDNKGGFLYLKKKTEDVITDFLVSNYKNDFFIKKTVKYIYKMKLFFNDL